MSSTEYVSKAEYVALLNTVTKMQKQLRKVMKHFKVAMKDDPKEKKESGFSKPTAVSKELSEFLGLQEGEMIARTQVTKRLNAYIKENNLQNPENKRIIHLNESLKSLVTVPDDVQLTFFNLQKYIKHHYITQHRIEGEKQVEEDNQREDNVSQEVKVEKKTVQKRVKK
jgi:chromatin remodeling complex protein RSC6